MKRSRAAFVFTTILILTLLGVAGFVWLRNWAPVSRAGLQQYTSTNLNSGFQAYPGSPQNSSRQLYGKDSLSSEEKRILFTTATEACGILKWHCIAYKVGMICLKHHLTKSEIGELFVGQVVHGAHVDDIGRDLVKVRLCSPPSMLLLYFRFDSKGSNGEISYIFGGEWYYLPPIDSVTPVAPIELPPLPDERIIFSDAAQAVLRQSRGFWIQGKVIATNPPDFSSLFYTNAKVDVEITLNDRPDYLPEYSVKIISQLRDQNLTDDKRALAIYLLGKINPPVTSAIPVLIEQINFNVSVPYDHPQWRDLYPWSSYPARDALLRIGEVSIGPIVQDLPGETNALRRQLLCAVVSTFGRTNWTTAWQPKPAIEQLQRLRSTESDPSRQQNIDAALDLLIDNKVDLNIGWPGYFGE